MARPPNSIHCRRVEEVRLALGTLPSFKVGYKGAVLQKAVALDPDHRLFTALGANVKAVIDAIEFFEFIQYSVLMK